jgi:hypothetical protein
MMYQLRLAMAASCIVGTSVVSAIAQTPPKSLAECREMRNSAWRAVQGKKLSNEMSRKLHDLSAAIAEDCRAGRYSQALAKEQELRKIYAAYTPPSDESLAAELKNENSERDKDLAAEAKRKTHGKPVKLEDLASGKLTATNKVECEHHFQSLLEGGRSKHAHTRSIPERAVVQKVAALYQAIEANCEASKIKEAAADIMEAAKILISYTPPPPLLSDAELQARKGAHKKWMDDRRAMKAGEPAPKGTGKGTEPPK